MQTRRRLFLVAVWALLLSGQVPAQRPIDVKQQERVVLKVHAIGVSGMDGAGQPPHVIDVDPDQGGSLSFELPWPDSRSLSKVTLTVVELPTADERQHSLTIDANLSLRRMEQPWAGEALDPPGSSGSDESLLLKFAHKFKIRVINTHESNMACVHTIGTYVPGKTNRQ